MNAHDWNVLGNYIAFVGGAQVVQYMEFGGEYPLTAMLIGIAIPATLNALNSVIDNLRDLRVRMVAEREFG